MPDPAPIEHETVDDTALVDVPRPRSECIEILDPTIDISNFNP